MKTKRRAVLLIGIFFLGLWVGAGTAQAKESRIRVARGVDIYVADLENGEHELSLQSPFTDEQRQVLGQVKSVDWKNSVKAGKESPLYLPAIVQGDVPITILVWPTGHVAYVPLRYDPKRFDMQWATRPYGENDYVVITSIQTTERHGTFLSKGSSVGTVTLDHYAHEIFSSEKFHIHLFGDGTLWLPASGAYFDVHQMESEETRASDGKLLRAVTPKDIERFRALHEQSGSTTPFGSPFAFEPGKDMTVIWHPIWVRMGPGTQASDPEGGMSSFLDNLGRLVWTMDKFPEEKEAAQAAFRLFADAASVRRELSLAENTPLETEHYREYVKAKRLEWKNIQAGKIPQHPEPPDWWVTRTPFWGTLRAEQEPPDKFERLAGALSRKDPVDREIAQAAARLLLGGEAGVRNYAQCEASRPLTDADYVKAAMARAHFSRVVVARLNLEDWLAARSGNESEWWGSLAQIIQLRPTPAMTDAAMEIIERKLGSARKVAEVLDTKDPLTPSDYIRVARHLSQAHFLEDLSGACNRILGLADDASRPSLN